MKKLSTILLLLTIVGGALVILGCPTPVDTTTTTVTVDTGTTSTTTTTVYTGSSTSSTVPVTTTTTVYIGTSTSSTVPVTTVPVTTVPVTTVPVTTTTLPSIGNGPNLLVNGTFDSNTTGYLNQTLPVYDPSNSQANGPVDVWTSWVETQLRPASGFATLFDYPSTSPLTPSGRMSGDLHAAIMYSANGNLDTTLQQSVTVPSTGTYVASIWVLGGNVTNVFTLSLKQGSTIVGSTPLSVDNSSFSNANLNQAWYDTHWQLITLTATLNAGSATFIIEHTNGVGGSSKNPFARFDDAALKAQ